MCGMAVIELNANGTATPPIQFVAVTVEAEPDDEPYELPMVEESGGVYSSDEDEDDDDNGDAVVEGEVALPVAPAPAALPVAPDEPRPGPSPRMGMQMLIRRVLLDFDAIHEMSDEEEAPAKSDEAVKNLALPTDERKQLKMDVERDLRKFVPLDSFNIELRRGNYIIIPVIHTVEPRMLEEDLALQNQMWTADSQRGRSWLCVHEQLTFCDDGKNGRKDKMTMIMPVVHPCVDLFMNRARICKIYYMHPTNELPVCIGTLKIKDGEFAATLKNAFTGRKFYVHRSFRASQIPYLMFCDTGGIIRGWTKGVKEDPEDNPEVWTQFHLQFSQRFTPVIDKAIMLATTHAWISDRMDRKSQKCCSRCLCYTFIISLLLLMAISILALFKFED